MIDSRPTLSLLHGRHKRLVSGHPWIFSNEVAMDAAAKSLPPGSLVTVAAADGRKLGTAFFNPHSLIAGRMLSSDPDVEIDAPFFEARLRSALALRESLYDRPFYRAVHSEADDLPGLIVDRFGDVLSVQINAAGMERCLDMLIEAFDAVFAPRAIVLRNDGGMRVLEGLLQYVRVAKGDITPPIEVEEGGAVFFIDPVGGQKTGWFFDQRDNRAFMAGLAKDKRVADFYSYTGGFAVRAALAGASQVRGFDSSGSGPRFGQARRRGKRCREIMPVRARRNLCRIGKIGECGRAIRPGDLRSARLRQIAQGCERWRQGLSQVGSACRRDHGTPRLRFHRLLFASHGTGAVRRGSSQRHRPRRPIRPDSAPVRRLAGSSGPSVPARMAYLKAEVLQLD